MTTPSQFDPLAGPPPSLRARIGRKFGRTIEPLAVNLLAWCRSLDHRMESVEGRLESGEAQLRAVTQVIRTAEGMAARMEAVEAQLPKVAAVVAKVAAMNPLISGFEAKIKQLETRADQSFWGREALVERMNRDDAREETTVARLAALEERAEGLFWGREALVERMNRDDAQVEVIDRRVATLETKVDEQVPLPLSFGLDYLAMGRRLAALEDQIELLLSRLGGAQEGQAATLVSFPSAPEKAAG
jgi:chromosome segregation ATPase